MKKSIVGILSVFCLLMLLFHPALAYAGASQGLILWAQVVLPTLLPFMICSGAIAALGGISILTGPFRPLLSGVLKLSPQGSFVFMSGLLCGYPMGAKTASDFFHQGRISLAEARYLLAISNHPSPMFVVGYVAPRLLLPSAKIGGHALLTAARFGAAAPMAVPLFPLWTSLAALYLPILPLSILARHIYFHGQETEELRFAQIPAARQSVFSFDDHLMSCLETMVKIGGYIMLFSILALYLLVLPLPDFLPSWLRPALLGFVEMTTGISLLCTSLGPSGAPFIVAAAAFGGLSGIFQTKSVLKNAGLSIRHYILWKLLHSAFSCILFYAAARGLM